MIFPAHFRFADVEDQIRLVACQIWRKALRIVRTAR